MRRTWTVMLAVLSLGWALAGCGGSSGTDNTPAPGASGAADTSAAAGAHDHMGGGGTTTDCSPSGTTISIVASGTKFNTDCIAAPANTPFTLTYENKDTTGHSIALLESHTATTVMFRAEVFAGPATKTFQVPAQKPGTYAFHCEVHPNLMFGTFIVK